MSTWAKQEVLKQGYQFPEPRSVEVHPMQDSRKVPLPKLIQRLGLSEYDVPAPLREVTQSSPTLTLRLDQHRGKAAQPVVSAGQSVAEGALIADVPPADLGCPLHAPRAGVIREVRQYEVVMEVS
jgi:hypothetical protein